MEYGGYEDGEIVDQPQGRKAGKVANNLPFFGNESTMNLNPLILTNIQSSSYFKVNLFKLKTYHEVVDEIYYQVKHMEPWERGSRKNPGVGMCGSVRGVGAGGIVSSAYCLLYKLYTLKLTRKQVNGLINHTDSPYIRGLGFMYLRYTQPPADLFDWYEDYLQDEEEIDVKAGGGQSMTMGTLVRLFLTKLDWFSTLFPRIPVPIQKQIEKRLNDYARENNVSFEDRPKQPVVEERRTFEQQQQERRNREGETSRRSRSPPPRHKRHERERERSPRERRRSPERDRERSYERDKHRDRHREERKRSSHDKEHHHKHKKSKHKHKSRERSREDDRKYR